MISAEDEPPGKAPRVELDVTESEYAPAPTFLFAPPAIKKNLRLSMPQSQQLLEQGTAGDDRVQWQMPKHVPGPTIGSAPLSLAGALNDEAVTDDNEVAEEFDAEPLPPEQVEEAYRGGRAFKGPPPDALDKMSIQQQSVPWLLAMMSCVAVQRKKIGDFL